MTSPFVGRSVSPHTVRGNRVGADVQTCNGRRYLARDSHDHLPPPLWRGRRARIYAGAPGGGRFSRLSSSRTTISKTASMLPITSALSNRSVRYPWRARMRSRIRSCSRALVSKWESPSTSIASRALCSTKIKIVATERGLPPEVILMRAQRAELVPELALSLCHFAPKLARALDIVGGCRFEHRSPPGFPAQGAGKPTSPQRGR
jgi:hypothetical protein